jgi:hypothetical protein
MLALALWPQVAPLTDLLERTMSVFGPGRLSTGASASEEFLAAVYRPGEPVLSIERRHSYWQGVRVAHDKGQRGAGSTVAIIDTEFDLRIQSLADAALPASHAPSVINSRWGRHGTAVALLVSEAAPEARLLLLDAWPGAELQRSDVAQAIRSAVAAHVDVINLSLEFESPCDSAPGLDLVFRDAVPDRATFLRGLDSWIAASDPYTPGGCPCEICIALAEVPDDTLIVTAGGNHDIPICPACFTRSLGVGFLVTGQTSLDGGDVETYALPPNEQNSRTEVFIPQPPGFGYTSFAAPLVSGLAATMSDSGSLSALVRMPSALIPLLRLLGQFRERNELPPPDVAATLVAGFELVGEIYPEAHRHWLDPEPAACGPCSAFAVNWYRNYASLLIALGDPGMVRVSAWGSAVAPRNPGTWMNQGTAVARRARASGEATRREGLESAASMYRRALDLFEDGSTAAGDLGPGAGNAARELARVEAEVANLSSQA